MLLILKWISCKEKKKYTVRPPESHHLEVEAEQLSAFEASVVSILNSRTARAISWDPLANKEEEELGKFLWNACMFGALP